MIKIVDRPLGTGTEFICKVSQDIQPGYYWLVRNDRNIAEVNVHSCALCIAVGRIFMDDGIFLEAFAKEEHPVKEGDCLIPMKKAEV